MAPAPSLADTTATFSGTVRNASGTPLAGVELVAYPGPPKLVTGADGRFEITLSSGPHNVFVSASGGGRPGVPSSWHLGATLSLSANLAADITIPGTSIAVAAKGPLGTGVAGVAAHFSGAANGFSLFPGGPQVDGSWADDPAATDGAGQSAAFGLPASTEPIGRPLGAYAVPPAGSNLAEVHTETTNLHGPRTFAFDLPVARVFSGTVRNTSGAPLSNVDVKLWPNTTSVKAGADGRFAVRSGPGPFTLEVTSAPGTVGPQVPSSFRLYQDVQVTGDREQDLVVPAIALATSSLGPTSAPVGSTQITVNGDTSGATLFPGGGPLTGSFSQTITTDGAGHGTLYALPANAFRTTSTPPACTRLASRPNETLPGMRGSGPFAVRFNAPSDASAVSTCSGSGGTGGGTADVTPPVLAAFSMSPGTVDITSADQTVAVTARVTDDASGVAGRTMSTVLGSQSSNQTLQVPLTWTSGTSTDATYAGTFVVPKGAATGSWKIGGISLADLAGNSAFYGGVNRAFPAGSVTTLSVTGTPLDVTPPAVKLLSVSPAAVNVSTAAAAVTVTTRVTDGGSGVPHRTLATTLASDSSGQSVSVSLARVSGSDSDGTYSGVATIPVNAAGGTWSIRGMLIGDAAGNSAYFGPGGIAYPTGSTTAVTVTTQSPDVAPPVLQALSVSPTAIDVSQSAKSVAVTVRAIDAGSGLGSTLHTTLASLNSTQSVGVSLTRASGSSLDSTYVGTATVPAAAAGGPWSITGLVLQDLAGNLSSYGSPPALPFPAGVVSSVNVTTLGRPCTILPPTAVRATGVVAGVLLIWAAPENACPATGYAITRPGAAPLEIGAAATSQLVAGLEPGVDYSFSVVAHTAYGDAAAPAVSATPLAPPPPPPVDGGAGGGGGGGGGNPGGNAGGSPVVQPSPSNSGADENGSSESNSGSGSAPSAPSAPSGGSGAPAGPSVPNKPKLKVATTITGLTIAPDPGGTAYLQMTVTVTNKNGKPVSGARVQKSNTRSGVVFRTNSKGILRFTETVDALAAASKPVSVKVTATLGSERSSVTQELFRSEMEAWCQFKGNPRKQLSIVDLDPSKGSWLGIVLGAVTEVAKKATKASTTAYGWQLSAPGGRTFYAQTLTVFDGKKVKYTAVGYSRRAILSPPASFFDGVGSGCSLPLA